jgi:DNA-binding MarR family transcriptional regulator
LKIGVASRLETDISHHEMSDHQSWDVKPALPVDPALEKYLESMRQLMRRAVKTVSLSDVTTAELTPTQLVVLVHLSERERMRIGMLAHALGAAQNTVSEVVTRMERSGMVVKERDPDDNRAVMVRLAPKGKAALDKQRESMRSQHRTMLEALTDEERQKLVESFDVVVSMAERARNVMMDARRDARRKQ